MQLLRSMIGLLSEEVPVVSRGLCWFGGLLLMGILTLGCTSGSEETSRSSADTSGTTTSPSASSNAASGSGGGASDSGDRSLDEKLEDARVKARVQQALVQERSLRVFEFEVTGARGRVTLQGDVNTRDEYDEAARTARRVEGVAEVQNNITVGGEPVSEGQSAEERAAASGTENGNTEAVYHTVGSGESLWRIAQQYGTSIQRLRALNDLSGGSLQPGQRIRVR